MDPDERHQAKTILQRIRSANWESLLASEAGAALKSQADVARETLREAGRARVGSPGKPVDLVLDLLGDRLLSDAKAGALVRRLVLESMPPTQWQRLFERYRAEAGSRAEGVHGNMAQHGKGSEVMAGYWHQGGTWARSFCELTGLPDCLAAFRPNVLPEDEEVSAVSPLPALHDFQLEVYKKVRALLGNGRGSAGMLSLPTGAGKTRVAVEAVLDHLAEDDGRRNLVVWIAQSDELQRQAWECFRQVWQTPPERPAGARGAPRRNGVLRILRAWGSRRADDLEIGPERTVLVAGIQQLASWVDSAAHFFDSFPFGRVAAVVVDEAHRVLTKQHKDALVALRVRAKRSWQPLGNAAPVIGLTATPWRTRSEDEGPLRSFFHGSLLTPRALGHSPIRELQRRRILSRVDWERLPVAGTPGMTSSQRRRFDQFHELPVDYLETLGRDARRNGVIAKRLLALPRRRRVLVFACSLEHASILTLALNRAAGEKVAALVTGKTPRSERHDVLDAFRAGKLQYLCNVGVLTTGFDAPKVDVVCITRPTTSAILYEQMVGRGLRGPKNGGTERCLVLDVQDAGLPEEIMSYGRVVATWEPA